MPWDESVAGIRMKVCRESETQIRLVEFSSEFVEPDWCRRGHMGYVLDGRLEVSFSGSQEMFEAGDGVIIPAGDEHRHKARALTKTATLILIEKYAEQANPLESAQQ
jgi:quercetin dioxygenase-like cupin family protein